MQKGSKQHCNMSRDNSSGPYVLHDTHFHIRCIEIWSKRRDGAWFSRMAHGNLTCAPFFLERDNLYFLMKIYMKVNAI